MLPANSWEIGHAVPKLRLFECRFLGSVKAGSAKGNVHGSGTLSFDPIGLRIEGSLSGEAKRIPEIGLEIRPAVQKLDRFDMTSQNVAVLGVPPENPQICHFRHTLDILSSDPGSSLGSCRNPRGVVPQHAGGRPESDSGWH